MVARLEEYEQRYEVAAQDPVLLEKEWGKWGRDKRQACMNRRCYDQYIECGYKGEPVFGEYGWCKNDVDKDKAEVITLFGEEPKTASVECLQLPNGKWIGGAHWMLSESGSFCGLSIFCTQYDTRVQVLTAKMRLVMDAIKNSRVKEDKKHIADVVRAMDDVRQLSLF